MLLRSGRWSSQTPAQGSQHDVEFEKKKPGYSDRQWLGLKNRLPILASLPCPRGEQFVVGSISELALIGHAMPGWILAWAMR